MRKRVKPSDRLDLFMPHSGGRSSRQPKTRWPVLIDDGWVSPPAVDPNVQQALETVSPRGAAKRVPKHVRDLLIKEIETQLPILRRELTRRNRLWFVEFCAKYGLGSMKAEITPDGEPANGQAPGQLRPADVAGLVAAILQGGALPAIPPPTAPVSPLTTAADAEFTVT